VRFPAASSRKLRFPAVSSGFIILGPFWQFSYLLDSELSPKVETGKSFKSSISDSLDELLDSFHAVICECYVAMNPSEPRLNNVCFFCYAVDHLAMREVFWM
jgi:hypothetical protein